MTKLEDKLSASIKAGRSAGSDKAAGKPATPKEKPHKEKEPTRPGGSQRPSRTRTDAGDADLNAPAQPLHPGRIWPD